MRSNGLTVTVVGWAATTPREVIGGRVPFTSFRVATTPRYFDNRQGTWADGRTEWLTVKVFREVAFNVAASIRKGDPVLVHGRLRTEEWLGENGQRTGLVIEASALGHDLTRGQSKFARTVLASGAHGADGEGGRSDAGPVGQAEASHGVDDPWAVDTVAAGGEHPDAGPVGQDDDPDEEDEDEDLDEDLDDDAVDPYGHTDEEVAVGTP